MRDEYREDFDSGRGGWGKRIEMEELRQQEQDRIYKDDHSDDEGGAHRKGGREVPMGTGEEEEEEVSADAPWTISLECSRSTGWEHFADPPPLSTEPTIPGRTRRLGN